MRITPDGAMPRLQDRIESSDCRDTVHLKADVIRPSGNTLWMVDDPNAIADGVAIDAKNVWSCLDS